MSWAEVKKINGNMAKSLDELITEKTNVKIQMVTVYVPTISLSSKIYTGTSTGTSAIETVDVSKSLVVPISPVLQGMNSSQYITGVTYSLTSTSVSVNASYYSALSSCGGDSFTVAVITFGGNVS